MPPSFALLSFIVLTLLTLEVKVTDLRNELTQANTDLRNELSQENTDLRNELSDVKSTLSQTRNELSHISQANTDLSNELSDVKSLLSQLASASDGFMEVRNRFFAVFLRDRFYRESKRDHQIIMSGNQVAHTANASMDALLFVDKKLRDDITTFVLLYGVMPKIVLTILSMLF